jgi:hypothetical protein
MEEYRDGVQALQKRLRGDAGCCENGRGRTMRAALALLALGLAVPLGADKWDDTRKIVQRHMNEAYRDGGVDAVNILVKGFAAQPKTSSWDRDAILVILYAEKDALLKINVKSGKDKP